MKNPAALDNFKVAKNVDRFAVIDVTNEIDGLRFFELSSAKTEADARARFFSRWIYRGVDREMMEIAQRRGSLIVARIAGGEMTTIEYNAVMLALV